MAILDTGIDYNHPELKLSYKGGYDFVDRDSDPMDEDSLSHGTFMAGIIAASFDNSNVVGIVPPVFKVLKKIGLISFKPSVDIYALRITPTGMSPPQPTHFCQALEWAVDKGMQIAVFSFGGPVSTFYQIPSKNMVKLWNARTPPNFSSRTMK